MEIFVERLQERANDLGLSQAEVARLADLNERRYNHYARGRRQPDLGTLVRIANALKTTPNWLLGVESEGSGGKRRKLEAKLLATCQTLDEERLAMAVALVTTLSQQEGDAGGQKSGGARKKAAKKQRK
ncbi:MAG: helix-turn-helix domain-containing protein [Alphaproteobacteria bacterium]|nr:helix-turn-helix domain-containing protein [Alphaproteobacteria bacterium]